MEDKPYIWENLQTFEKQPFIDKAHTILIAREPFIPPKYVYDDKGKVTGYHLPVEKLAIKLFEQSTIEDYERDYYYPSSAAELVNRYDIETSDVGVIISTADKEEAKRIKRALILLLNAPTTLGTISYDNSWSKRISNLLLNVDEEK